MEGGGLCRRAARRTEALGLFELSREIVGAHAVRLVYSLRMGEPRNIELVFAPQGDGGYHVYAPDLPGLHTQGDTLDEATANAQEALKLYVEGLRQDGRSFDAGVIRRRFPIPA
jgi:predicted RNase H-like HicB family nuclease